MFSKQKILPSLFYMTLYRIRLISTLIIVCVATSICPTLIAWWVWRELLNMYAIYVLFYRSKETSPADVNMYIIIMYIASVTLFARIIFDNTLIFTLGLLAKLNLAPIHSPVISMSSKMSPRVILSFFILPKLPYLLICSEVSFSTFIIPAILVIYPCVKLAPSEIIRFSLVISSNALAFAFSIDINLRLYRFLRAIVWGYLVRVLAQIKNVNIKDNYYDFRFLFNIMLPIPRSYSWLIKIIILQERSSVVNFHVLWWLTVMMSLPFWYVLCITLVNYNKVSNDPESRSINMLFPLFISRIFSFMFLV